MLIVAVIPFSSICMQSQPGLIQVNFKPPISTPSNTITHNIPICKQTLHQGTSNVSQYISDSSIAALHSQIEVAAQSHTQGCSTCNICRHERHNTGPMGIWVTQVSGNPSLGAYVAERHLDTAR